MKRHRSQAVKRPIEYRMVPVTYRDHRPLEFLAAVALLFALAVLFWLAADWMTAALQMARL